jgi:glyoxylase-like metal-dependent hydrolase (beta-lactamase superfamily II)
MLLESNYYTNRNYQPTMLSIVLQQPGKGIKYHMTHVNRRQFLGTLGAAGAVSALSFVPSALSRLSAQAAARLGKIVITDTGALRVHTYVAPDASVQVTSHIIETPNQLVLVDTQLLQTFAAEFRAYVDSLGKPIERVILSHAHPDHFLGGAQFTDVPFVTTPEIAAEVQAYVDAGSVAQVAGFAGESEVPETINVPEGALALGDLSIDGVSFTLERVTDAESTQQVNVLIPDAGVIVLQDLLYANVHFFPGINRPNWIATLEGLRDSTQGYSTLLAGHGVPTTRGELDQAIRYLTAAEAAVAQASTYEDIVAALQAEFPAHEGAGILPFWASFFTPA